MKNKAIIFLLMFSALVLIATIASVNNSWNGQSTGTINETYGWQKMSDYPYAGTFNAGGVYSDGAWFSNYGHPVTVGSDGNFSLSIPFRVYSGSEIVFVGISTASDPTDNRGWMLVGCDLYGKMGVTVAPHMDNTQNIVADNFQSLGSMQHNYGALYTAQIQSTDSGKTAVFSLGGNTTSLPLSGPPKNVIVYVDNGGNDPAHTKVPLIYNISYSTSNITPIQPPSSNSYTLSLNQGWNLVSFPVVNTSLKASSLKGAGVQIVSAYNRSTGDYDSYNTQVSPLQYDIALKTDTGYFIYATKDTSVVIAGQDPISRSTTIYPGWNLIGWSSLDGSSAKYVANEPSLPGREIVSRFNASTGDYDSFAEGISPDSYDFTMHDGAGYFLYTGSTTPETLFYEG